MCAGLSGNLNSEFSLLDFVIYDKDFDDSNSFDLRVGIFVGCGQRRYSRVIDFCEVLDVRADMLSRT